MSFNLSQYSSAISCITSKHDTHDEFWLLPGISSAYFCFACAVETLEDEKLLRIHKKTILAEMLEVFLSNNNIWTILCNKRSIFVHVLNLLVKLLSSTQDGEYASIVMECLLLIMKNTHINQSASIILEIVLKIEGFITNGWFLKLLSDILKVSPTSVEVILVKKHDFVPCILSAMSNMKGDVLLSCWSLIHVILSTPTYANPPSVCKQIIIAMNEMLKSENDPDVIQEVLKSLIIIIEKPKFNAALYEHESSKLTSLSQSIFESFKKLLISTNESIQAMTINCISTIACLNESPDQVLNTLSDILLDKGISEFLLEILSTTSTVNLSKVFECLENLMQSKTILKMGHMIYGFSSVIDALAKTLQTQDSTALMKGLSLLSAMLTNEKSERQNSQTCKQTQEIIKITVKVFEKSELKCKASAIDCFSKVIALNNYNITVCDLVLDFLETALKYVEKDVLVSVSNFDPMLEDLLCNLYQSMHVFAKYVTCIVRSVDHNIQMDCSSQTVCMNDESADISIVAETIYHLCDCFCIPQAVLKFFPTKSLNFQKIFFEMLVVVLEIIPEQGEKIALKLAESSFFQILLEFKIIANRNSLAMDDIMGRLLFYICSAVDTVNEVQTNELLAVLTKFNVPLKDWRSLFNQNTSLEPHSSQFIEQCQTATFALLACSHKVGQVLIPLPLVAEELQRFAHSENSLSKLSLLGKKYFLYLWSYLYSNSIANHNVFTCFCNNVKEMMEYIVVTDMFLIWLLKCNATKEISINVLEKLIRYTLIKKNKDDQDDKNKLNLLSLAQTNNVENNLLEICYHLCTQSENEEVLQETLDYTNSLLLDSTAKQCELCKVVIHRIILTNGTMNVSNMSTVIKCLNDVSIASEYIIDDIDMKLLCRILVIANKYQAPSIQIEVLNFIYILIKKATLTKNSTPTSVVLDQFDFLLHYQHSLCNNTNVIKNTQSSLLLERVHSAVILLLSEVMYSCHVYNIQKTNEIILRKDIFIQFLTNPSLPLMQITVMSFWKTFFSLGCKSSLLKLVDDTNTVISLQYSDIQLIFIVLQNLCCNSEKIIQKAAIDCMKSLFNNLDRPADLVHQPWNYYLKTLTLERLSTDDIDIPSIQLLSIFVTHSIDLDNELLQCLQKVLKMKSNTKLTDEKTYLHIVTLFQNVIQKHIRTSTYDLLKEIKKFLHHLETTLGKKDIKKSVKCVFSSLNGVIYMDDILTKLDVFDCIKNIKLTIEKQLSVLDNDATDSGEDYEE